ncbi:enoyl-CoA hydratase-related protein [Streptomyces olivaceus]|uniref:enoyl-CoA hydratase-related protein n=1 Tax=Streptomyces olivaceus TaxID=47716 RepID=UPI0033A3178A
MSPALARAIEWCDTTDDVRAVVVTGAGDRSFNVGSDIGEPDRCATPWDFRNRVDYCAATRAARTPTVASVGGYALGGGLATALSGDIRRAAETAKINLRAAANLPEDQALRLRARPADHLLRHRGHRRGPPRVRREAHPRLPQALRGTS